jgi:hypothetical protein
MGKKSAKQPAPNAPHRGRVQAQGSGTEKSVSWDLAAPPTKSEVVALLDQLWAALTRTEQDERKDCYASAKSYIRQAPQAGIAAQFAISFRNRKLRGGVRIDLEVWAGDACIDNP